MTGAITEILIRDLDASLVDVPASAPALAHHLELIRKWNKVYNLTAIQTDERMVVEHVLDSLSILPWIRPAHIVDVGTGAGFPGLPLAIARPQWRLTLVDSSHKRCAFLRQAVIELSLANVDIVCARVEQFRPAHPCDTVVSRAFADLGTFCGVGAPLLNDEGILLAMKGIYPEDDIARLPSGVHLREAVPLTVPGLAARRHAIIMTKASV